MAEAAHDVLYLRGCLRAPAFSATLKTQGALAAATCFSGRNSCISTPRASMFECLFVYFVFFPVRLFYSVMFSSAVITLRRLLLIINARFAVFSLFAAVCCGRRDRLKESGHVRSAPWTSTAGRQSYYVQFRQEAGTAGAVASDGDLATNSQIVGSEGRPLDLKGRESTEERSRTLAVSDRCDVGRMVAAAAAFSDSASEFVGVVCASQCVDRASSSRSLSSPPLPCGVIVGVYSSFIAIYSSSPSLRHVLLLCRHVLLLLSRRVFIRCIMLTRCSVCLSWTHSLSSL
jgi:hypothetical protein